MLHLPDQPETTPQPGQQFQPDYTEYIEYNQPYQPQSAPVYTSHEETPPPANPGSPPPASSPSRRPRGSRTVAILAMTVVMLLVFGVGLFSGWAYSHSSATTTPTTTATSTATSTTTSSANSIQAAQEAVVQKVSPSVVEVTVQMAQGEGIGSGVIFDTRGYIVTNAHVVSGAQTIQVTLYDGTKLTAQLVGIDSAHDLAVIKISTPKTLVAAAFGDSSQAKVGEDVLAIGNPLGITQTVTNGIISALNRSVSESQSPSATIPNAIQTDAPINPGNSGGALVDLQGRVIGILTLSAVDSETNTLANGVGFAIPSNTVQTIANQIIQTGQ